MFSGHLCGVLSFSALPCGFYGVLGSFQGVIKAF